jgi:hypothetical protein
MTDHQTEIDALVKQLEAAGLVDGCARHRLRA